MVTIKEIAKHCNVSIATVSNIINGKPNASKETKERVLQAIEELNYTPNYIAKNLKTRRTRTIGVVVEDITVFCAPEIIDGITKCCEEKGYHILLTNLRLYKKFGDSYYDNEKFFQMVRREVKELIAKQVDGIVYVTAHERALKCLPENLTVPASMAYGYTKSDHYPSVVVDDKKGAYEIVNYVISMGHKNIGVITGKERSIHTHDRLLGYQKALYDHSLFFNPDAIVEGGWTREGGYAATDRLLEQNVTAIFCMNDIMAGGVYDRLEELGMIPGSSCFFYLRFHFFRSQDFSPLSLFTGFCSIKPQNPVNFQLIIIQLVITEVAQLLPEEPLMHLPQILLLLMQHEHFSGLHQIIMNNPVRKDVLFHSQ